jgi:hypothetical protein
MAARTIALSDTLATLRTTINSLSQTDIGDPSTLTTSASSIVGAINEIDAAVDTAFTIRDSSSTVQQINSGDVFTIAGTSNQITATVSATDTLTIALASTISGLTSLDSAALTIGSVPVATQPFAIAQAIALG